MKFHGCIPLLALLLLLNCGCGTPTSMGPSGVSPGLLMTEVTYPSMRDAQTRINLKRDDIQILGVIKADAKSQNILWIWASGDNGYGNLMKAARQAYPQTDGVIDVQVDTEYKDLLSVCAMYFLGLPIPILSSVTTHMEGRAFQFKR
jgi:hypothetical protein